MSPLRIIKLESLRVKVNPQVILFGLGFFIFCVCLFACLLVFNQDLILIAQAALKHTRLKFIATLLLHPLKGWDYRCEP